LVSFVVAPVAGKLAERVGVRWFLGGGLLLVGIGELLMAGLHAGDEWTALLGGFIVCGVGIGMTNPALATAAIGVVSPQHAGMASGINSTFRQVGIATGIAAYGAIFTHLVASRFTDAVPQAARFGSGQRLSDFVSFGGAARTGNPALARAGEAAFTSALNDLLTVAAILAFVGAVLSAVLTRPRDFAPQPVAAPEATAAEPQPASAPG
jgi:MFS family permease